MFSLTYSPQKHEFKVFIFLLNETEMAQNNSLFVWKTSNYSRGRSNLRNDMNQVPNLKSLGFTGERIAKLLGVFPEVVLCDIDFRGFFDAAFDSHIFSIIRLVVDRPCCKTSIICISCRSRLITAPTLKSSLLLSLLHLPLILGNSLANSCVTNGCWFSYISHFAMLTKSISDCTTFFDAFPLFIILEQCTGNRLSLLS